MPRLLISIFIILLAFGLAWFGSQPMATAGFYEGVAAYDKGDYKTALREFRKSAVKGDAKAQYNLGVMHRKGTGVVQNYHEAERRYRNAAEQGHSEAQFSLGLMFKEGLIGKMYKKGSGIVKNYVKAHKWFNIAVSHGHLPSKKLMGVVEKRMSPSDIAKARNLAREWMSIWPVVSK
jgi:uncharacterized protein